MTVGVVMFLSAVAGILCSVISLYWTRPAKRESDM